MHYALVKILGNVTDCEPSLPADEGTIYREVLVKPPEHPLFEGASKRRSLWLLRFRSGDEGPRKHERIEAFGEVHQVGPDLIIDVASWSRI